MWSYYGSKSKVIRHYPAPKFGKIIEPFAGTARYALKYFDRDVLIVDKYEVVVKIWKWLQLCSPADILKLPRLKEGEKVSDYKFDCAEASLLMGFFINGGAARPMNQATFRVTTNRPKFQDYQIKSVANNLFKIKHWKIMLGDYKDIDNQEATWFIDPPYQFGGEYYPHSSKKIDYGYLGDWCKSREGQVIVCENTKATWLDFSKMKGLHGSRYETVEAIWSNVPHDYLFEQQSLFTLPNKACSGRVDSAGSPELFPAEVIPPAKVTRQSTRR
jgi:hypothetical protein